MIQKVIFKGNPVFVSIEGLFNPDWLIVTDELGRTKRFSQVGSSQPGAMVNISGVRENEVLSLEYRPDGIYNYKKGNNNLFQDLVRVLKYGLENIPEAGKIKPVSLIDYGDIGVNLIPSESQVFIGFNQGTFSPEGNLDYIQKESKYLTAGKWVIVHAPIFYVITTGYRPVVIDHLGEEQEVELIEGNIYRVKFKNTGSYLVCTHRI